MTDPLMTWTGDSESYCQALLHPQAQTPVSNDTCVFCGTAISQEDESWPFCPDCLQEAIEDSNKSTPRPTFWQWRLAPFFCWVADRHDARHHNASYDVCPHWLCRFAYWLERKLWYGGTP